MSASDLHLLEFRRYADELGVDFPADFSAEKAGELMRHVRTVGALIMKGDSAELYCSYLRATCDNESVEGDLFCDTHMASVMIREHAKEIGNPLACEKLAPISVALCVMTSPYRHVVAPNDDDVEVDVEFFERFLNEAGEIDEQKLRADFERHYARYRPEVSKEYVNKAIELKLQEIRRYIAGDQS